MTDAPRSGRYFKGRFRKNVTPKAIRLLVSKDLEADKRLIDGDIIGNLAHAIMLYETGILQRSEAKKIVNALEKIRLLNRNGKFRLFPNLEDVHMNVEKFVRATCGDAIGGKLHTGRSRNDQVSLDTRLYIRQALNAIGNQLVALSTTLVLQASKYTQTLMPGYTHLQHAQPITYGHWLCAFAEMFIRDFDRFHETYARVNLNPLGACALAGTSWPIDRAMTASLLGFDGVQENSLDVVTSRGEDTAEVLAALSIFMIHAARLCEDLLLWSTQEFGMAEIDEAYCTGSSAMPQKKNPDVAELIRAKASEIHGNLISVLSTLKNLPTGYSRDTQATKYVLVSSLEDASYVLPLLTGMISTLKINKERMKALSSIGFTTATDLADLVSRQLNLPFRQAHEAVSRLVNSTSQKYTSLSDLDITLLRRSLESELKTKLQVSDQMLKMSVDPAHSLRMKKSLGSPKPTEVERMIRSLKRRIQFRENLLESRSHHIKESEHKLYLTIRRLSAT
ncbi:MAG: argininosuccinate lyase [Candidatus Bathyarchaeia archaeon]